MKPQAVGLWAAAGFYRAARQAGLAHGAGAFRAFAGDALLGLGVVFAGLLVWSPRLGVETAKETILARRARRRQISDIGRQHGAVWARHARRSPGIWARYSARRQ
jgi:hypothetical protein